ncbi:MAG: hypothetical protein PHO89_11070, partial [Methylacidiphilaceae bacterium]|nr:hypothetical protein [Candidatus Methylacidiphilaceae bacterium]
MNDLLIPNISPVQPARDPAGDAALRGGGDAGAFQKALRERLPQVSRPRPAEGVEPEGMAPLKFSAHALNRIKDRSIAMGTELMDKLEKAVDTAAKKGSQESLILSDNAAFIVSVKNKTVITILDRS